MRDGGEEEFKPGGWGGVREGGRKTGEKCGWEREGMRKDTKRQTEGKREWSILEP